MYTSYKMHLSSPAPGHRLIFPLKLSHPTCAFKVFGWIVVCYGELSLCLLWYTVLADRISWTKQATHLIQYVIFHVPIET